MINKGWNCPRWIAAIVTLYLSGLACTVNLPGQETAVPVVATPVPVSTVVPGEPTVAPEPGYPAGTIIVDQTNTVSSTQGAAVEMVFEATAMQPVSIATTIVSGDFDYALRLFDQFGNIIASYDSSPDKLEEAIPEVSLPFSGTYRVTVRSLSGDGSLQTVITALGSVTGGGTISGVGQGGSGLMGAAHTYHTYQIALNQGETVNLSATANVAASPDLQLMMLGPDGRYVTQADDVLAPSDTNAVVSGFIVPISGNYTVIVSNVGDLIGAYRFSVDAATDLATAQGAADLEYEKDYRARFFEGSNLKVSFDGTVGDAIKIAAFSLESTVDIDVYLYSPFGQVIAYALNSPVGVDETISEIQLPYTGRYQVEFVPTGTGESSFHIVRLSADQITGGGQFGDQIDGVQAGRVVAANTFHVYQFNGKSGEHIDLRVFSLGDKGTMNPGFALIGPHGLQLVFADDSNSDNPVDPELVNYELVQTGTFTVIVYMFTDATGTYELEFTRH